MTYIQALKTRKVLTCGLNVLAHVNPFYIMDRALTAAGYSDSDGGKVIHKIGKDVDHKIALAIDAVRLTDDEKFDLNGCSQMASTMKRIDRAIDSLSAINGRMLNHPVPDKYVGRLLDERKDLQRVIAMVNRVNSYNTGIIRVEQNSEVEIDD